MDGNWRRYAIYWLPGPGPLADFGAGWLGWDNQRGQEAALPAELPGLPVSRAQITEAPRKYGFHGTVKPPFRLTQGETGATLQAAFETLAAGLCANGMPGLRLARIGPFLTLQPEGDSAGLAALAAAVVEGLDPFRAPPEAAEIARRNPDRLSPAQRAQLERWGYPYVMQEFRFHLTLTGPLPDDMAVAVEAALAPVVAPVLPRPFRVESLCLCGEAADGRFHLIRRVALAG